MDLMETSKRKRIGKENNSNISSQSGAKRPHLDSSGARVYAFLARRIGYTTTPQPVPLLVISKAIGISYKEVRNRVKVLVDMKLVEKWTVKHPTQFKITYYRLTFRDTILESQPLPSSDL